MSLFGAPESYLGIDLGTSTSKIVELAKRGNRIELVTYAEANFSNPFTGSSNGGDSAVERTVASLAQIIERSGSTAKNVIAALPGGAVFSTVLNLPNIPESEMEKAVQFAARDVVPVDIDEMVLGWSKVGSQSHMATDHNTAQEASQEEKKETQGNAHIPVFVTAAPKEIVNKYVAVFQQMKLSLVALEVETFPLVRSLLSVPPTSTLLVDIGARTTTFHIIDKGIVHVSQTIDLGGYDVTATMTKNLNISEPEMEKAKIAFGILPEQDPAIRTAIEASLLRQVEKAKELLFAYEQKEKHHIVHSVLIGGGANLKGLAEYWSREVGIQTVVGNPWKNISYPKNLEQTLLTLGPRYGVAVGLALRGFAQA